MLVKVFVKLKQGVLDPQGQTILGSVNRMGFDFVKEVKVGKFFEIEVEETTDMEAKLKEISSKLLANPIIEQFEVVTGEDA